MSLKSPASTMAKDMRDMPESAGELTTRRSMANRHRRGEIEAEIGGAAPSAPCWHWLNPEDALRR